MGATVSNRRNVVTRNMSGTDFARGCSINRCRIAIATAGPGNSDSAGICSGTFAIVPHMICMDTAKDRATPFSDMRGNLHSVAFILSGVRSNRAVCLSRKACRVNGALIVSNGCSVVNMKHPRGAVFCTPGTLNTHVIGFSRISTLVRNIVLLKAGNMNSIAADNTISVATNALHGYVIAKRDCNGSIKTVSIGNPDIVSEYMIAGGATDNEMNTFFMGAGLNGPVVVGSLVTCGASGNSNSMFFVFGSSTYVCGYAITCGGAAGSGKRNRAVHFNPGSTGVINSIFCGGVCGSRVSACRSPVAKGGILRPRTGIFISTRNNSFHLDRRTTGAGVIGHFTTDSCPGNVAAFSLSNGPHFTSRLTSMNYCRGRDTALTTSLSVAHVNNASSSPVAFRTSISNNGDTNTACM